MKNSAVAMAAALATQAGEAKEGWTSGA